MSFRVDTSKFNAMVRDLSRLSGVTLSQVITAETKSVLQKTVSNTVAASVAKLNARVAKGTLHKAHFAELKARRGLAKQSWAAVAAQVGIELDLPGYARNATVKGKAYPQKVKGVTKGSRGSFQIRITNAMLTAINANGRTALLRAINGRVGYFRTNVKKEVFSKVSTIAKRYPGIRVRGI